MNKTDQMNPSRESMCRRVRWSGGSVVRLGSCLLDFFPQLKLEGAIFFHTVGEQPFGSEEHDHSAVPIDEPARILRPVDAGDHVGIAIHPASQYKGHPLDEGLDPILCLKARGDDIELEFSHGSQDRLPAHMIG
jgi:hypothetical protein